MILGDARRLIFKEINGLNLYDIWFQRNEATCHQHVKYALYYKPNFLILLSLGGVISMGHRWAFSLGLFEGKGLGLDHESSYDFKANMEHQTCNY